MKEQIAAAATRTRQSEAHDAATEAGEKRAEALASMLQETEKRVRELEAEADALTAKVAEVITTEDVRWFFAQRGWDHSAVTNAWSHPTTRYTFALPFMWADQKQGVAALRCIAKGIGIPLALLVHEIALALDARA
jgi:hypothetical protein